MTLLVEILDWPEDLPVSGSLISFFGGVGGEWVECVLERVAWVVLWKEGKLIKMHDIGLIRRVIMVNGKLNCL